MAHAGTSSSTRPQLGSSLPRTSCGALLGRRAPRCRSASSGLVGSSYGSTTPVNPLISPANAFAYRPFTSRARALLDRGVDVAPRRTGRTPRPARAPSARVSSYGEIAETMTARAVAGQPRGDPADALDVRVAVLLREAEALRQVRAHGVAVEVLDERPAALELGADDAPRSSSCRRPRAR